MQYNRGNWQKRQHFFLIWPAKKLLKSTNCIVFLKWQQLFEKFTNSPVPCQTKLLSSEGVTKLGRHATWYLSWFWRRGRWNRIEILGGVNIPHCLGISPPLPKVSLKCPRQLMTLLYCSLHEHSQSINFRFFYIFFFFVFENPLNLYRFRSIDFG